MLLVLNVVYYGMVAAHVAIDLHRNRAWACVWLKRYDKEGVVGLKNKPRSGRPSRVIRRRYLCSIQTTLKESNQGWTTKHVEELIIKKSGIKYHYTHIYRTSFEKGDLNKRYQERYMLIQHPEKRKRISKKDQNRYLWISNSKKTRAGTGKFQHSIYWTNHSSFMISCKTRLDR